MMKKIIIWMVASMMIATATWGQQDYRTFTVNGVSFKMIKVEGGTFQMGATGAQGGGGDEASYHATPVHSVTLSDYYIGEIEVTNQLWKAVAYESTTGKTIPELSHWEEWQKFIYELNVLTGQHFRMPTEAEWEYAARGGKKSRGFKFSGSNSIGSVAWYDRNSSERPNAPHEYLHAHSVKTKQANELGIYDMSGNVAEWTQDKYGDYSGNAQTNPVGSESFNDKYYYYHVVRGGGFRSNEDACRVWQRSKGDQYASHGLRLVLPLGEQRQIVTNPTFTNPTFTIGNVKFKMIKVEGGTFIMGNTVDEKPKKKERPHSVTLSDYYLSETEVTQELWQTVMGSLPTELYYAPPEKPKFLHWDYRGEQRPICFVSWNECQIFIQKLNAKTGKNFRLPTEAEWEFAARGGKKSRNLIFSGSNSIDNVAHFDDNTNDSPPFVKTKTANELGLYDMSGSVYEWCQDWYDDYGTSTQTNPTGPYTGTKRVVRGGSWTSFAKNCSVWHRNYHTPYYYADNIGLRLALSN